MRVGFMGSPAYALPTLERLHELHTVTAVVSQPAKPAGRGKRVLATPVERWARERDMAVWTPQKVGDDPEVQRALADTDVTVTVAYGQRLPASLINAPRHGILNAHASLLPAYRGAAPLQHALLDGLAETGVSVMRTDVGMDTGPVCLTLSLPIPPDMTLEGLFKAASQRSADAMEAALDALENGTLACEPQDDTRATKAPQIRKADGRIRWNESATRTVNRWRALQDWPGIQTAIHGHVFKVNTLSGEEAPHWAQNPALGEVLAIDHDGVLVACATGAVRLREVTAPGKSRVAAHEWARNNGVKVGDRFD